MRFDARGALITLAGLIAMGAGVSTPARAQEEAACCEEPTAATVVESEAAVTAATDGAAVARLVRDLKSSDEDVFRAAVKRLGAKRWGHAVDRSIVEILLSNGGGSAATTSTTRQVALIQALGTCHQGCAAAVLKRKAADPSLEIRQAAKQAMERQAKMRAGHEGDSHDDHAASPEPTKEPVPPADGGDVARP